MRVAVVIAAALLLTACPGNHRAEDESQTSPPTTTANPQAVPEKSATMNPITPTSTALPSQRLPAVASTPIQVDLTEYQIQMPDTIPAGPHTFHIVNGGHYNHNFVVEGNGISQRLPSDLPRGDSADMTVNLKPGTYTVYCPVDKHRSKGMERTITVK